MTSKRKADLQRKLSMTSVPRPPAGLAERLKADIPQDLMSTARDRQRFSRSTTYSMGVAASILLLVSGVYVSLKLLSRGEMPSMAYDRSPMASRSVASQPVAAPQAEVTITLAETSAEKKTTDSLSDERTFAANEVAPAARREQQPAPAVGAIASLQRKDERDAAQSAHAASRQAPGENYAVERGAATGAVADSIAPAAPAPTAPPPPPMVAASAPPPMPAESSNAPARVAKAAAVSKENAGVSPALVGSAQAADFSYAAPRAVFGISIDPAAFTRVKQYLEQGSRPAAASVDLAGLVNYFAGTKTVRGDLRLDVEASRTPLASDDSALIRFTIDTPYETLSPGESQPPVATNADVSIWLNSQAVISHRLVGADELTSQATLLKNVSVTGLVDLQMKASVSPRTKIARITLRYRSVPDGKTHSVTQDVRASDVMRTWESATRRHRLATLGAVWGQSLSAGTASRDVAKTAEKLATEAPGDTRARDLAAVATKASRLQSFGPTGGR